jgi:DNA segregation ATPase FtsK/SpoIIIE, S-DNA-T family
VLLDIKESALGGIGPHGLMVGATGSGKSETARAIVLGLAATHPPDKVNFLLVDFKGGSTFARLEALPHTAAVITNLVDDLSRVDRLSETIAGELARRQELLRAAGAYANAGAYEVDRAGGAALEPLPSLLLVVDEFSELLSARPDFIEMFMRIGRIGRAVGVHLLLASQRLEEGRLRGLDTYLSYRIGLRTFSAMESRTVLGVPDAYELPNAPGHGYLRAEPGAPRRFRALPVTVPLRPLAAEDPTTVLERVVTVVAGAGPRGRPVWLPPLAEPPTLDALLPAEARSGPGGLLRVPVGVVDRPFDQRQDPLWVDLAGASGHVLITGAPQSGKSTLVRDLVAALALTHTPAQAQFYCLDFGGGTLLGLRDLPHVGAVGTGREPDLVRRTVAEIESVLAGREAAFAEHGIDGMAAYRRSGRVRDRYGEVFLVVDGWAGLRTDFEALESRIQTLALRGVSYGVHLVLTANRPSEVRLALRETMGTRLELRLSDPFDSEANRRQAANVPAWTPGRGLTRDGLHFLAALPRIDGDRRPATLAEGVAGLVATVRAGWDGPPAPEIELLPAVYPYADLPAPAAAGPPGIPIGLGEDTMAPVHLDFAADPHLVILGDTGSGKTNLLRAIVTGIAARHSPEQAEFLFLDYRYGLQDVAADQYTHGHAFTAGLAKQAVESLAQAMDRRLPSADLAPERLRARDWWSGPDTYLIVDDYDLVATTDNPLRPLLDHLARGRDIGLHLILARTAAGASRAVYEPVLQRLRELGSPAVLLSAPREEGPLFGVRPEPLPPGRAHLATRRGSTLIQTPLLPPGSAVPTPST